MPSAALSRIPDAVEVAALDAQQVVQLLRSQAAVNEVLRNQIEALRAQIEWFKRQVFGQESERPQRPQRYCLGSALSHSARPTTVYFSPDRAH